MMDRGQSGAAGKTRLLRQENDTQPCVEQAQSLSEGTVQYMSMSKLAGLQGM